jgi:hypothetical protein
MSDQEVMHRYIKAREEAKRHQGTELSEHWASVRDDAFNELSPTAQTQVKLDAPDEDVGL